MDELTALPRGEAGSITVVGIDLAKNVFHLHGIDASGNVVVRKKMSRTKLATFTATMPPGGEYEAPNGPCDPRDNCIELTREYVVQGGLPYMQIIRSWAPILALGLAVGCTGSGSSEEEVVESGTVSVEEDAVESGTVSVEEEVVESGTFSLEILRVSFVGSAAHGSGLLHYDGKTYKFKVNGLGAGGFGASKAKLRGTAFNLKKREDFAGTYVNVRSGVAVGEADIAKSIYVKNENGVELKGTPDIDGVQLNLGVDGVVVSWDD